MNKYLSSYWIRSAFFTFLQRFSLTFFGVLNFAILARSLSKTELGIWGLFLTVTGIFEATKSNLLKNAHIKYVSISKDTNERTVIASSSLLINFLITILFILLILLFSNILGIWLKTGIELSLMLKWFIPGMIAMIFFAHFEAIQQSHMDFKGGFAGYLIRQVLFFIFILIYKIEGIPLPLVTLVIYQSISIMAGSILLFFYSKKYLFFQFRASRLWVKRILGYGGYIFGSGMVSNIYVNMDQLMTAKFMNPSSVAYYNVASRINVLIDIPSYAAAEILFPKASIASHEEGREKVKYLYERMVGILTAFTLPLAVFIIIFPRFITSIVAGNTFNAAATILQLYMISGVFRPAQHQAANMLNSIGKTRTVLIMNTVSLAALLIVNYFCLLRFGFYGTAIGTLITNLLSFTAWYFVMKKIIGLELSGVIRHMRTTYKLLYDKLTGILFRKDREPDLSGQSNPESEAGE